MVNCAVVNEEYFLTNPPTVLDWEQNGCIPAGPPLRE